MKSLQNYINEKLEPNSNYTPTLFKDKRKTEFTDEELFAEFFLAWCGWVNGKDGLSGNPRAQKLGEEISSKYNSKNYLTDPVQKLCYLDKIILNACGIKSFRLYTKDKRVESMVREIIHLNMDWILNDEPADDSDDIKLPK